MVFMVAMEVLVGCADVPAGGMTSRATWPMALSIRSAQIRTPCAVCTASDPKTSWGRESIPPKQIRECMVMLFLVRQDLLEQVHRCFIRGAPGDADDMRIQIDGNPLGRPVDL